MRWLSLFSGIGGLDLALAPAGAEVAYGCDSEPFVAELFQQRFGVPVIPDVREVDASLGSFVGISAGFPCQPVSTAGRGLAQDDERWLWPEVERVIEQLGPELVCVENVPGLRRRGLVNVLESLARLGYDAEWDGIPAASVGAPHLRDRLFLIGYPTGGKPLVGGICELHGRPLADAAGLRAGALRKGKVYEVTPQAPVKLKRRGDWSVWAGRNLTPAIAGRLLLTPTAAPWSGGGGGGKLSAQINHLLPTPTTQDASNVAGPSQLDRRSPGLGALAGHGLLPTPVANDVKGDVVGHLRNKNGWDKGQRAFITSLAVLARNGFEQATPEQLAEAALSAAETERAQESGWKPGDGLFPTATASDAKGSRRETARTEQWTSNPGRTLGDAVKLWPTPRASLGESSGGGGEGATYKRTPSQEDGSHGKYLQAEVLLAEQQRLEGEGLLPTPRATDGDQRNRGDLIAHAKGRPNSHHTGPREEGRENEIVKGALNPMWVDWLMGYPPDWTNPNVTNDALQPRGWDDEPLPRVAEGVPQRVARLTATGNAVVPQAAAAYFLPALRTYARLHRRPAA